MPLTITDINTIAVRVADMVGATEPPVLTTTIGGETESDIEKFLAQAVVATVWAGETEYALGDVVIPTSGNVNGHKFVLVDYDGAGFESGSTEPTWQIGDGAFITDGNLTWREYGPAPEALWDVRYAIYLGWKRKAALVASRFDLALDGRDTLKRSQMVETFNKMAAQYEPLGF
jgi:hypothetical protein